MTFTDEMTFRHYKQHVGHDIQMVRYGDKNVTIECHDCNIVIEDCDISI